MESLGPWGATVEGNTGGGGGGAGGGGGMSGSGVNAFSPCLLASNRAAVSRRMACRCGSGSLFSAKQDRGARFTTANALR